MLELFDSGSVATLCVELPAAMEMPTMVTGVYGVFEGSDVSVESIKGRLRKVKPQNSVFDLPIEAEQYPQEASVFDQQVRQTSSASIDVWQSSGMDPWSCSATPPRRRRDKDDEEERIFLGEPATSEGGSTCREP